jgi:hypothetical protein
MKAPREVGFSIRTWAVAYAHTQDPRFLKPIESLLNRFARTAIYWQAPQSAKLSMAIDCDGAARLVPEPLASNLQHFAEAFKAEDRDAAPAPLWNARPVTTTAQVGLMCLSRYDNTGHVDYRKLLIDAAHAYLKSLPANDEDVWPGTFGQAISLQVGAWRHTADPNYLDRARQLADLAVEKFWGTNALPRASYKSDHYESITGADTLALALVELHLNILHITAVRCPPNTIDR